jgi:hypothetical protein
MHVPWTPETAALLISLALFGRELFHYVRLLRRA